MSDSDLITELQKRLVKMEEREIERERKALILSAVLGSGNVINAEQITLLIDQNVKLENGKLTVVNGEGGIEINRNGHPVTIEEFITEFLVSNPHFVRALQNK